MIFVTLLLFLSGQPMTGGDVSGSTIAAWGRDLFVWVDSKLAMKRAGPFGEGGCLMDVDRDGRLDVVVTETGDTPALVWLRMPDAKRTVIDTGVVAADVLPAELHGRRGVLVVHKRAQVRFYYLENDAWISRDLYSFYSAADQGGLLLSDVDGDGRVDIYCGNYWIQNPESFELSWRLFAIKLWSDDRPDAITDFAESDGRLLALQREKSPGRVAWFSKPADPKQLWIESSLGELSKPRVVRGDTLLIVEAAGQGRIFRLAPGGLKQVASGMRAVKAWVHEGDLIAIGQHGVRRARIELR